MLASAHLSHEFGARRINTMLDRGWCGSGFSEFGSVVFFRRETHPIPTWKDLRGLRTGAVAEGSFGGWLAAKYEAIEIHRMNPFRNIQFLGSHDAVVEAVGSGLIDAGVVRTNTLERMAAEGKIDLMKFSVIEHCQLGDPEHEHFTFLHSTQLYPEWPFAAAAHTPRKIAESVAVALLRMTEESEAAQNAMIKGWTIPGDYTDVRKLLIALRAPPFEQVGKVTYLEAVRLHWKPFLAFILLFIVVSAMAVLLGIKLRDLRRAQGALGDALEEQKHLKEAAEISNQAKSEFLGIMSHELRTPLNPIMGLSELLLEMLQNEENISVDEMRDMIEVIQQSGANLNKLLSDILDYTQIGGKGYTIDKKPVNLPELIQESINEFLEEADQKKLRLIYQAPEDKNMYIESNPALLRTVFCKLLKNAIDYSVKGEIRVTCYQQKDQVCIGIMDQGIGIAESELEKIFLPFYQVDSSTSRKVDGVGLGLSLVRKILNSLDGSIQVTSQLNSGSCFTVCLKSDQP